MAPVRDLTRPDANEEVLHRTDEPGGLFGGDGLTAEPLASFLAEDEVARYLLTNGSGVTTAGPDGERTVAPADGYRTAVLVTDRRLCAVVGSADGDETVTLPLADVLDARVERAGLLSSRLVVETPDERQVRVACRGTLDAVVETLCDDGSAWAHAERLLEDADAAVSRAREHRVAGRDEAALDAMDEAERTWTEALDALRPVHEAAVDGLAERVAARRAVAERLRRAALAGLGGSAHGDAQTAWDRHEYERAAEAYDRALESYRASATRTGPKPTDDAIASRIAGAAGELALLRVAPQVDAETAAGRAAAAADPGEAAVAWERAHGHYRTALALEWGEDGSHFAGDRRAARESAATAASEAIDARLVASRQWLAAGDRVAAVEGTADAAGIYDRAAVHLERAMALARRVLPQRVGDVADHQAAVEGRRDGSIDPRDEPASAPVPPEAVVDAIEAVANPDGERDGVMDPLAEASADAESNPPATPVVPGGSASPHPEDAPGEDAGRGQTGGGLDTSAGVSGGTTAEGPPVGLGDEAGTLGERADVDRASLGAALDGLGREDLAHLVADVWADRGWSISAFVASGPAVYDVVGVDPETGARLVLWVDPEDSVDAAVLKRIATTRARASDAERAGVVTTGDVSAGTRRRARALGVDVVDGTGLCDLLVATGHVAGLEDG